MLTDDQIFEAASIVVDSNNSAEDQENAKRLAYALKLVYESAVSDAIQKIKDELRNNNELIVGEKIITPDSPKLIGRMPWYMRKDSLEKKFKKHDSSEEKEKFEKEIKENTFKEPEDDY